MNDPRLPVAELAVVAAELAEQAAPKLRAFAEALIGRKGASAAAKTGTTRRRRATPQPTVGFSEIDSTKADRALRRAGHVESNK